MVARFLQNTQNLVSSRCCCFAEESYDAQKYKQTCIALLINLLFGEVKTNDITTLQTQQHNDVTR